MPELLDGNASFMGGESVPTAGLLNSPTLSGAVRFIGSPYRQMFGVLILQLHRAHG